MKYTPITVGLGGTFDHLHDGHRHFLKFASNLGEKLVIGLTHDKLTKGKAFAQAMQPYQLRKKGLIKAIRDLHLKAEIVQLMDAFGPTIEPESEIHKLAVTEESAATAERINQVRSQLGLSVLPIFVSDWKYCDTGELLSSTMIRAGVINRSGIHYASLVPEETVLGTLARAYFSKPVGEIVSKPTIHKYPVRILVGDVTTTRFQNEKWSFDLCFVDEKIGRDEKVQHDFTFTGALAAPAGAIYRKSLTEIEKLIKVFLSQEETQFVRVLGQEDLLTAACILVAPLYSVIYYGQPAEGLVEVRVTEELKLRVLSHLSTH